MQGIHGDFRPNCTIARQHVQIQALVEAVSRRLDRGQVATRNLVSLLNSLAAHLEFHFELEEEEGYFEDLVTRARQLSEQVEQLLREHQSLLGEITGLLAMAQHAFSEERETTELAERFHQFRKRILDHEESEIDLLQEAYTKNLHNTD